jgi:SRSO17 transposase
MVPACRTAGEVLPMPPWAGEPGEVDGFLQELRGFHAAFRACVARREPREHGLRDMVGQFSPLERQAIEPIALQGQGGNMRARHRGLRELVWDDAQRLQTSHPLVHDAMGDPAGVLLFDETGCPQKGQDAVGGRGRIVQALGPVANGQVGVFAASAARQGYALVDQRRFLPEPWWTEAYAARRTKCQVAAAWPFPTKPP